MHDDIARRAGGNRDARRLTDAGSNRLPILAAEIGAAHAACARSTEEVIRHAIEAGCQAARAKQLVSHGGWLPWLQANLPGVSVRTCQRYMRAAEAADQKRHVSYSSLRAAQVHAEA